MKKLIKRFLLSTALVCGFVLVYTLPTPTLEQQEVQKVVMITNVSTKSGGSGVIIESNPTVSYILTNAHVCHVVESGGLVFTADGRSHKVGSYRKSTLHDLCLIEVNENLHQETLLSNTIPTVADESTVVGHPALLPTIITKGFFSSKEVINVTVGKRECTQQEKENKLGNLICALNGGVPVEKAFESILISSLIMPGSSGSPVFNSNGYLAALVFAGREDLSYGFAVPLEFIKKFLNEEVVHIKPILPTDMEETKFVQTDSTVLKNLFDILRKLK